MHKTEMPSGRCRKRDRDGVKRWKMRYEVEHVEGRSEFFVG